MTSVGENTKNKQTHKLWQQYELDTPFIEGNLPISTKFYMHNLWFNNPTFKNLSTIVNNKQVHRCSYQDANLSIYYTKHVELSEYLPRNNRINQTMTH